MAFGGLFAWPLLYGGIGPSVWFLVVLFSCSEVLLCDYSSFVLLLMALLCAFLVGPLWSCCLAPYGPSGWLLTVLLSY